MVDDASEGPNSPAANGTASPRENGLDKLGPSSVPMSGQVKKEVPPPSPRSGTSSNASTPSAKKMEEREKPTTPISKPVTPTSAGRCRGSLGTRESIRDRDIDIGDWTRAESPSCFCKILRERKISI